jgi:hypothetical protein
VPYQVLGQEAARENMARTVDGPRTDGSGTLVSQGHTSSFMPVYVERGELTSLPLKRSCRVVSKPFAYEKRGWFVITV